MFSYLPLSKSSTAPGDFEFSRYNKHSDLPLGQKWSYAERSPSGQALLSFHDLLGNKELKTEHSIILKRFQTDFLPTT